MGTVCPKKKDPPLIVDRENKNTGLGSEVRLYYPDALALAAFDTLPSFPAGKKLVNADSQFPEYRPPAGTTDPIYGTGIVWSDSEELRRTLVKITTSKAVFPRGYPWGAYPRIEHTGAVVFDLTEYLAKHCGPGKPLSVGIRQASGDSAVNDGNSWINSRNHVQPMVYGPRLVLRFQ